jgi:lipopolysaccharide transport system permease protein
MTRSFHIEVLRDVFNLFVRRRNLIGQLVKREIQSRYRGSILGILWSFVNPLMLLCVYTLVFGVIFQSRWSQHPSQRLSGFAVVLFCGLVAFNIYSECLVRAPGVVLNSPNFVKKVVFPLEALPVVLIGTAMFHGLISLSVLIAGHLLLGGRLHWTLLLTPIAALPLLLLTMGLSWLLASLGVFVRDIGQAVSVLVQMSMFVTPIFYPLELLPPAYRRWMVLNPLAAAIDDLRRVVLWGTPPDWPRFLLWLGGSGLVCFCGFAWFRMTKHAFADVV